MTKYLPQMEPVPAEEIAQDLLQRPQALIAREEARFRQEIEQTCDLILQDSIHMILLTGPSASGKTTTAKMIAAELARRGERVDRISLDNFYRPAAELPRWEDGYQNYESVEGLDIPCFQQFVESLFQQGRGLLPVFDFNAGQRRKKWVEVAFDRHTYLIFEGIHALNPQVTQPLAGHRTVKIYISVHSDFLDGDGQIRLGARDLRLCRRLLRDFYHRGTQAEGTMRMWDYVLRGEDLYIRPFRRYADVHINSTHTYEPFLYHDQLAQLLANTPDDSTYQEAFGRLEQAVEYFYGIPESWIPSSSLIQEFLPGPGKELPRATVPGQ